jgi:hypothetical protein
MDSTATNLFLHDEGEIQRARCRRRIRQAADPTESRLTARETQGKLGPCLKGVLPKVGKMGPRLHFTHIICGLRIVTSLGTYCFLQVVNG